MDDTFGWSKGRLGKVRVTGFDGAGEQRGLGGVVHNMKSSVVVEGGANVEATTGLKVPRLARVGLVVNEDFHPRGPRVVA